MARRRHNPRRAKTHYSYTIAEVAELYGVHRQTVRNWLADGLQPNEAARPFLIHGTELNRFHDARRSAGKSPCGPGELYCFGCGAPRRPAGSMADLVLGPGNTSSVVGICPVCDGLMNQRVGAARLAVHRGELEIVARPQSEHLKGS